MKNKRILITGGAGFIGSNLCEKLLHCDNEIVCLDNLSTGNLNNISDMLNHSKFTFIEGDIRNLDICQKAAHGVDFILHQAALGSVPRSIKDPITSNSVNVDGFLNMLVASRDQKVKRFIYAASSSTYGDSKSMPKVEHTIGKPLSPYAITKYVNELYADIFSKTYGLETIGLRYFNVFGKKQDPDGPYAAVIPKFIIQLINGESPIINGDGSYSRDFTYVENVVQANILSLKVDNDKAINNVYNVAYGQKNSLNTLVSHIKNFLTKFDSNISKIKVLHGPIRKGDIPHSHANIDKAKKLLGYNPKFSLEEGLKEAINWYWNKFKK